MLKSVAKEVGLEPTQGTQTHLGKPASLAASNPPAFAGRYRCNL